MSAALLTSRRARWERFEEGGIVARIHCARIHCVKAAMGKSVGIAKEGSG